MAAGGGLEQRHLSYAIVTGPEGRRLGTVHPATRPDATRPHPARRCPMSTQAQHEPAAVPTWWCCGRPYPETELTRLGQHPEVGSAWAARCSSNGAPPPAATLETEARRPGRAAPSTRPAMP